MALGVEGLVDEAALEEGWVAEGAAGVTVEATSSDEEKSQSPPLVLISAELLMKADVIGFPD